MGLCFESYKACRVKQFSLRALSVLDQPGLEMTSHPGPPQQIHGSTIRSPTTLRSPLMPPCAELHAMCPRHKLLSSLLQDVVIQHILQRPIYIRTHFPRPSSCLLQASHHFTYVSKFKKLAPAGKVMRSVCSGSASSACSQWHLAADGCKPTLSAAFWFTICLQSKVHACWRGSIILSNVFPGCQFACTSLPQSCISFQAIHCYATYDAIKSTIAWN